MARPWLSESMKAARPVFAQIAGTSIFVSMLGIAAPIFVLQVYDRVIMHAGINTLYGLLIGIAIAISFDFVLRQLRARLLQRTALEFDLGINEKLMKKLLSVPLRILETRSVNDWETAFRDANLVRDTLSGPTALAVADMPFAILFIAVIYVIAPPLAAVVLVILPVFMTLAWWGARLQSARVRQERENAMSRDAIVSEIVAGRTTIKSLGLDDGFARRWEQGHAELVEAGLVRGRTADNFVNMGVSLGIVTTVTITSIGAVSILDQQLTIGALIATNMLASRIVQPLQQLVSTWRVLANCRQAISRLDEVFALPEERRESAVRFERPSGKLTFDGVTFRYDPESEPVVDGIRLTFEPKGLYGLMGANGSGKTTLLKLALGLYAPDEGRVLIDDADIGQFSRRDLTRWIGYVPQDVRLFAGTIRENIDAGRADADDEDILRAARLAGVHDFIAALPDGYGTRIGEGGASLPGGVRQKIGVARAVIDRPPIVILDEPTNNLDRDSEQALAEALRRLAGEHTVIAATHSGALLAACHSVLVLDRGRIVRGGETRKILPELFRQPAPVTAEGGRS